MSELEIKPVADRSRFHAELKWLFLLTGLFFLLQLAGLEVVGGDPDRFFRPLKSEMVRRLRAGNLPLWSDRFGFGMPLAAQSEIGAFYPLHWLIYPVFGAGFGYRLSMVLHQALAAVFMLQLAKQLGATGRGAVLGALIYLLGGFPTIQASKEWAILGMAWIPATFLGVELWLQESRRAGLSLLAAGLACLALAGHFQLAQITSLGLLLWVLARTGAEPGLVRRWPGLLNAVAGGVFMAMPQLLVSWNYAREVEATSRSAATLSYYSYPLWNFSEFVFPLWTRLLQGGPEGAYWTIHQTTQFEACQFIGRLGLIFAVVGLLQPGGQKVRPALVLLITVSLCLSTMPQWSPGLYAGVLRLPGMGFFRCPSRYGILLHLGLALLAGQGFGKPVLKRAVILIIFMISLSVLALWWMNGHGFLFPGGRVVPRYPIMPVIALSAVAWVACAGVLKLNQKRGGFESILLLLAAVELYGCYFAGPTRWGWSLGLPQSSQALMELKSIGGSKIMLAGPLDNMPVTAGLTSAGAYFGVTMPPANEALKALVERANQADRQNLPSPVDRELDRLGVTHQLQFRPDAKASVFTADPVASVVLGQTRSIRPLYLRELAFGFKKEMPRAWLANRGLRTVASQNEAFSQLIRDEVLTPAPILKADDNPSLLKHFQTVDANASVEMDPSALKFKVTHTGPAVLVVRRTFDKGWKAVDDQGRNRPIIPVFGGLQAVLLATPGVGQNHETVIRMYYWPDGLSGSIGFALAAVLITFIAGFTPRPLS